MEGALKEPEFDPELGKLVNLEFNAMEELSRAARIIKNSSRLMQLMNAGMLNETLLRQNKLEIEGECVKDFQPIFIDFTSLFQELIEQKNIKLTIKGQPEGDETAVKLLENRGVSLNCDIYMQILYNVFMNACKFNVNNGSISVRVMANYVKERTSVLKIG